MKIEKVNDHQIRCTLTREDLADRELKLSELAYGTEKAKDLFRDMMQQASFEFGFEAEDIPLMIEAIPLNSECIVLIITKVEDPDELDTRFAKFAPSVHEDGGDTLEDVLDTIAESADDMLDLFKKIQNSKPDEAADEDTAVSSEGKSDAQNSREAFKKALQKKLSDAAANAELTRIYLFDSLREVTDSAHVLSGFYRGSNSLYKQDVGTYLLVVSKNDHTPMEFTKVCSILSEFGACIKSIPASEAYLEEHFEPIVKNTALQSLSCI